MVDLIAQNLGSKEDVENWGTGSLVCMSVQARDPGVRYPASQVGRTAESEKELRGMQLWSNCIVVQ